MKKLKICVFDIDGTILTTDHKILASTKEGMSLLQKHDIPIVLASARPPLGIDPIVRELDLDPFYISLNGALVLHDDEILLSESMQHGPLQEVVTRAFERNLSVNVYTGLDWYIHEVTSYSTREEEIVGFNAKIKDLSTVQEAHKILMLGDPKEIAGLQQELIEHVPDVEASRSSPIHLEVVRRGVSKAHALEILCEHENLEFGNIAAFGDGENDLPMLKVAGISVAMGNAHPSLKEYADYVTGNNNEDGVLQGIRKVLEVDN